VRLSPPTCLAVLTLASCGRQPLRTTAWAPQPAADEGAVVARVGEVPIFAAEVSGQATRTGKPPREALADLIALHLLAERERRHWPPDDPGARAAEQEMLVQRLVEREFEPSAGPQDMPDDAVRVLYERAHDTFVHGRLVDVAVLSLTPGKKAGPEVRTQARRTMIELKALVDLRTEKTAEDLQQAIGDQKWHERRVQYFRFLQAGSKPYTAKFGAEVAKMKTPGETSGVIEDEYGFYIARYLGDRPAQNQSFDQVKKDLREGYYARWRQAKFLEWTAQIEARHEVEIHPGPLATAPGS
jgi:hypothetical protein